jgi:amino acid transporter
MIAGASGLVLLVVMFLPWYGVSAHFGGVSVSDTGNAWEVFSTIDIILFLVALVAVGAAVGRLTDSLPEDVPVATIVTGAGALAVLLILYRIIDLPGPDLPAILSKNVDFGRRIGLFLGLIAAAGITYGGYRSVTDAAEPAETPPPPVPAR